MLAYPMFMFTVVKGWRMVALREPLASSRRAEEFDANPALSPPSKSSAPHLPCDRPGPGGVCQVAKPL
jgi:hypothetical protein